MTSATATTHGSRCVYPWMFGRNFDLLFFFVPVTLGFAFFALARYSPLSTSPLWTILFLEAFGAGAFHWGPTWFAYFDRKNRQYWKSNPNKQAIFFAGPVLVMLACIFGNIYCPWLVQLIAMPWALQHVVQQNVGILLLYHNQNRGEAIVDRTTEIKSQQAPAIFFAAIFFWRVFFHSPQNFLCGTVGAALALWALYKVAQYIFIMRRQVRDGAQVNVPALGFWAMSVLAFLPFAFIGKEFSDSFLIPVTIHWFQYIGLNFMLVKNKYGAGQAQVVDLPNFSPMVLFFITCTVFVVILMALNIAPTLPHMDPLAIKVFTGIYLGLANIHYLLDAFLWRFREAHVRQSILPYLLRPRQSAQVSAAQ